MLTLRRQLPLFVALVVAAPALDRARRRDAAGVELPGRHGGEGHAAARRRGLPVVVAAPAFDGASGRDAAAVVAPGRHGGEPGKASRVNKKYMKHS